VFFLPNKRAINKGEIIPPFQGFPKFVDCLFYNHVIPLGLVFISKKEPRRGDNIVDSNDPKTPLETLKG